MPARPRDRLLHFAAEWMTLASMKPPHPPARRRHRVSVAIPPEVLPHFQRLADATGTSLSSVLGDWLRDTADGAEQLATVIERAKRDPASMVDEVMRYSSTLTELSSDVIGKLRQLGRDRSTQAGGGAAGPAPRRTYPHPPSSNTGGKPPQNTHKKP